MHKIIMIFCTKKIVNLLFIQIYFIIYFLSFFRIFTKRYGREDEEVMGLKFCNEAIIALKQIWPTSNDKEELCPLQVSQYYTTSCFVFEQKFVFKNIYKVCFCFCAFSVIICLFKSLFKYENVVNTFLRTNIN